MQATKQAATTKGRKFPGEPLSEAEVRALLRQCSMRAPTGVRNRALILIMYRCGLRIAEALALRPVDVDAAVGTVRVLHGKGDKARTVGIDDGGLDAIARWLDWRRELGLRNGQCTCPQKVKGDPQERSLTCTAHLFCTLKGGPMSDRYVRIMMKRIAAKAKLDKRVHPHGLRHTHAAELVAEGVPMNVIRDQLGHSSLAVTDRYLRNVAPGAVIAVGRARTWSADQ
jgi:site-specific recombinase XerD